jgi:hypothetical protein
MGNNQSTEDNKDNQCPEHAKIILGISCGLLVPIMIILMLAIIFVLYVNNNNPKITSMSNKMPRFSAGSIKESFSIPEIKITPSNAASMI